MFDLKRSLALLRRKLALLEHIRKEGDKYVLYSKDGKKRLGEYPSKAAALRREGQIEYFKHAKEAASPTPKKRSKIIKNGGSHEH